MNNKDRIEDSKDFAVRLLESVINSKSKDLYQWARLSGGLNLLLRKQKNRKNFRFVANIINKYES